MEKIKRKARNKMSKTADLLKPLNVSIEKLGSKDDPCFGKHYDPRNEICGRCGDSEICAIVMGQLNHLKRAEVETKQEFMDISPHKSKLTPEEIKKSIKARIRSLVKMAGKNGIEINRVVDDIYLSYNKDGYSKARILKIINKLLLTTTKFHKSQNQKLQWNN